MPANPSRLDKYRKHRRAGGDIVSRIMVSENDERQARVLQAYLEREGHSVVTASDGRAALEEIRRLEPQLVILDVMMAKVDDLDVCHVLRVDSNVPIIMVTACSTEDDLLLGLDLGADDYVTKPYSPRELLAQGSNCATPEE